MPYYKLMFRGDSRDPFDEKSNPFDNGLQAVDMSSPVTQEQVFGLYVGFLSKTAVCLTPDLLSAVAFPMDKNPITWIYCLYIDINAENTVNGFSRQVVSYLEQDDYNFVPLEWFAREWAVKEVPNNQIAFAIKIKRVFEDGKVFCRKFRVLAYFKNQHFTTPSEEVYTNLLSQYIHSLQMKDEISANSYRHGFKISDPKGPGRIMGKDEFDIKFLQEIGVDGGYY